ncbi:hypothetical protein NECAME_06989 [Necator americanus]|uniref:Uncharacterized protein n=1 Tax=Necator americanus TaxID=51031 RepID=W2TQV8_NECAM|nr:hypothetical protein NECAME_06989 [Necator americanus]ETN84168.1 hypothetical protein NECAME_06989 [Necator americanus]
MHNLITPEPFSKEIMEKARQIKSSLPLPACLDSPFFLARFLRAHGGDEDLARQRVEEYLSHRQTLGYADLNDTEIYNEFPIGKATYKANRHKVSGVAEKRFCISRVDRLARSGDVHVFVHKMGGTDLKEIMKVIPLSYVLHSYFMLHEIFGRAVAETEKRTVEYGGTWRDDSGYSQPPEGCTHPLQPVLSVDHRGLPEYGNIPAIPGEYVIRIRNPSTTWFPVKVNGAADFKAE